MSKPIWTGSLTFGLVSIPIRLHPAVKPKDIRFHLLSSETNTRVRQKFVSPPGEEEVAREDLVRGYEVEPERYVIIEDEELDSLAPLARRTIEITEFVNLSEVDPIYFDRPYYLAPEQGSEQPYRLVMEALRRTGKIGLGTFVLRTKEHLVALRPLGEALCVETLFFHDEVVDAREFPGIPVEAEVGERELRVAEGIIEAMSGAFEPEQYRDEYREALMDLIERKAEGEAVPAQGVEPPEPGKIVDLMAALEASLAEARRRRKSA
jgi:DNA end-binding protein Ku